MINMVHSQNSINKMVCQIWYRQTNCTKNGTRKLTLYLVRKQQNLIIHQKFTKDTNLQIYEYTKKKNP